MRSSSINIPANMRWIPVPRVPVTPQCERCLWTRKPSSHARQRCTASLFATICAMLALPSSLQGIAETTQRRVRRRGRKRESGRCDWVRCFLGSSLAIVSCCSSRGKDDVPMVVRAVLDDDTHDPLRHYMVNTHVRSSSMFIHYKLMNVHF